MLQSLSMAQNTFLCLRRTLKLLHLKQIRSHTQRHGPALSAPPLHELGKRGVPAAGDGHSAVSRSEHQSTYTQILHSKYKPPISPYNQIRDLPKKTDRLQNEYLFFLRLLQNESVRASLSFGGMVKVLSRHKILLPAVPGQRKPSSAPCPRAVSVWRCRSLCRPRCPPPGRSRRRRRTRGPPARRPKGCPAARPRPHPRGWGCPPAEGRRDRRCLPPPPFWWPGGSPAGTESRWVRSYREAPRGSVWEGLSPAPGSGLTLLFSKVNVWCEAPNTAQTCTQLHGKRRGKRRETEFISGSKVKGKKNIIKL